MLRRHIGTTRKLGARLVPMARRPARTDEVLERIPYRKEWKRIMKITAVVVAALLWPRLGPPSASAATPTDRKIAALQRQVKTLQRQVGF